MLNFRQVVTITTVICTGGMAHANTCQGKWGNDASATVEFLGEDKVNYCYEDDCMVLPIFVNGKDFLLRVGDSSATVSMEAVGDGFKATWRSGDDSSEAALTCQ